jgi:hypothetical protein
MRSNGRPEVPRIRAEAVRSASPALCFVSPSAPTASDPVSTTEGLEKFSRARITSPFES